MHACMHTYHYSPTHQILWFLVTNHGRLRFGLPVFCSRGDPATELPVLPKFLGLRRVLGSFFDGTRGASICHIYHICPIRKENIHWFHSSTASISRIKNGSTTADGTNFWDLASDHAPSVSWLVAHFRRAI